MDLNIFIFIYAIISIIIIDIFYNFVKLNKKYQVIPFIFGRDHKFFILIDFILAIFVFLAVSYIIELFIGIESKEDFFPFTQDYYLTFSEKVNKYPIYYFFPFFIFTIFFLILEFVFFAGYKYIEELVKDYFPNNSLFILYVFFLYLFFFSIFILNLHALNVMTY
jgi:hypothetical protein